MKKIVILLYLSISLSYAMQKNDGICHLARVPKDVRDLIAMHLTFRNIETQEYFINRTQIKSYNVSDYHRDAQHYKLPHGFFSAYSPDNLVKVYLDQGNSRKSKVVVSDTVPKKEEEGTSLDTVAALIDEDKEYYQTIDVAISSDGQWFGRLAQHKVVNVSNGEAFANCNRAQITVIHIPTKTKRDFAIPVLLKSVAFLDFNKQGTKIITHGTCYEKEEPISFMYNVESEKEHKAKCKKELDVYLKQRGVCKDLKKSLQ